MFSGAVQLKTRKMQLSPFCGRLLLESLSAPVYPSERTVYLVLKLSELRWKAPSRLGSSLKWHAIRNRFLPLVMDL